MIKKTGKRYLLPFGPDLISNNLRKLPVTPKLELYIQKREVQEKHRDVMKDQDTQTFKILKFLEKRKVQKSLPLRFCLLLYLIALFAIGLLFSYYLFVVHENTDKNNIAGAIEGSDTVTEEFDPDSVADYALLSAGAEIFDEPTANAYITRLFKFNILKSAKWPLVTDTTPPQLVLQPWKSPGECWPFEGQQASVRIKLSHNIIPNAVTIEHIAPNISPTGDITSAPKDFSVYTVETDGGIFKELLGHFQYSKDGKPNQSFMLQPEGEVRYPSRILEFIFHTNQGHPHYTCIYKIRVHGKLFSLYEM